MVTAQAPGHSSWHWEAEQQWATPRRLMTGKHFGRSAAAGCDPFAEHEKREDACRAISAAVVREFAELLTKHTATAGSPWHVEAPTAEKPAASEISDYEAVVAFYHTNSVKARDADHHAPIAREAAAMAGHILKLPNILMFRMCVDPTNACSHCKEVARLRSDGQPGWSAKSVLEPLKHNNYWPYLPRLGEPAIHAAPQAWATASLMSQEEDTAASRNPYLELNMFN